MSADWDANCATCSGLVYFGVSVEGPKMDLHSGVQGGSVFEPMTDLVYLLDQLLDVNGHIRVPGMYDQVDKVTDAERKLYESIDFDLVC